MNSFENSILPDRNLVWPIRERLAAWLFLVIRTAALALMVAVPLVVVPTWTDAFNYPKVLVVYALAATMVTLWAVTNVLARGLRWRSTLPEIPLGLFLLTALVSSWVSVSARLTFFGAPDRYDGLLALIACIVFYYVGVHFFGSERGFRVLATVGGVAAVMTMVYGLSQLFLPPLFPTEGAVKQLYASLGYPRALSTLGNPVTFGGYLAFMAPLVGSLALAATGRSRLFWLAATGLGYVTILVTFTRAAWLAVLLGSGILMIAVGPSTFRRFIAARVVFMVVAAIGLALTLAAVTPAQLASRASSALAVESGSTGQRVYIWRRTIEVIRSRPLLGWGLETLGEVFPYEREGLVKYFGFRPVIIDKAHNDLLQMAVSIGIPGAAMYLWFWAAVVGGGTRTLRRASGTSRILAAGWLAAVVAYLVQAQFSYSTVAVAPVVWLLAGSAGGWDAGGTSE